MDAPDNYQTTYDSKTKIVFFYSLSELLVHRPSALVLVGGSIGTLPHPLPQISYLGIFKTFSFYFPYIAGSISDIHQALQDYPALLNSSWCVDIYQPWNHEALVHVAEQWLRAPTADVHTLLVSFVK